MAGDGYTTVATHSRERAKWHYYVLFNQFIIMEELQNRVNELEAKVQEMECTISGLRGENDNLRKWWLQAQGKYNGLLGAIGAVVDLAKGGQ